MVTEEKERTNYADNFFLKNDEATKGGRDTTGRKKMGEASNVVVEEEEENNGGRRRDQLSPMRDNMVGSHHHILWSGQAR